MPNRPPKSWWDRMYFSMSRQYPRHKRETSEHYRSAISRIVGGIWSKYPQDTKDKLTRLYENPIMQNPLACPVCGVVNPVKSELRLKCLGCGHELISVKIKRK